MTAEQEAELRRLATKATTGEWDPIVNATLSNCIGVARPSGRYIYLNDGANREYACAAVNALPALLDTLAALRAENARLRDAANINPPDVIVPARDYGEMLRELDRLREALRELLQVIADEGPIFNPDHPEDHGVSPEAAETIRAALEPSQSEPGAMGLTSLSRSPTIVRQMEDG